MSRLASVNRATGETDVSVRIDLDGQGTAMVATGIGFFDHLLTLFARHASIDLEIDATGDLETGSHHTIEDVGITLGQALDAALADRSGIARYGNVVLPMDEVLIQAAVDISGRPLLVSDLTLPVAVIGGFEVECLTEFLHGLVNHARLTLHVRELAGGNAHHVVEGAVKAVARALGAAVRLDPRVSGVPSTKGSL
jgi:imidazoleglycerol-phosphate dehydratase